MNSSTTVVVNDLKLSNTNFQLFAKFRLSNFKLFKLPNPKICRDFFPKFSFVFTYKWIYFYSCSCNDMHIIIYNFLNIFYFLLDVANEILPLDCGHECRHWPSFALRSLNVEVRVKFSPRVSTLVNVSITVHMCLPIVCRSVTGCSQMAWWRDKG